MVGPAGKDKDAERQLEDLREQQRAISGVLRAVAGSDGLQPVLDEIVEACRRLCDADHGALYLLKEELLHVATNQGEPGTAEYDREHPHALDRTTGAGRTAVTGEPVHIPDVLDDPEYVYSGPYTYRALLGVPIKIDTDLIGVVVLVRREPRAFSEGHIELVQTFADQAAIALANARLLEAVERQRAELSRVVSPQVAELITSEDGERLLAGHRAYIIKKPRKFFGLRDVLFEESAGRRPHASLVIQPSTSRTPELPRRGRFKACRRPPTLGARPRTRQLRLPRRLRHRVRLGAIAGLRPS
jgi:hypothetical protein